MTYLVSINLTTTPTEFPADTLPAGHFKVSLYRKGSSDVVAEQESDTPQFLFSGIANDNYTAVAVRNDVNGNALGSSISQDFAVPEVPATVLRDLPAGFVITSTPE